MYQGNERLVVAGRHMVVKEEGGGTFGGTAVTG